MRLARLKPRIERIARELNLDRGTAALLAVLLEPSRDDHQPRGRPEDELDEDD